jgi:hypothetical protein
MGYELSDFDRVSLFDYYAAKSPEPPEWFEPDMDDRELRYFGWRYHYAKSMTDISRGNHVSCFS